MKKFLKCFNEDRELVFTILIDNGIYKIKNYLQSPSLGDIKIKDNFIYSKNIFTDKVRVYRIDGSIVTYVGFEPR